MADIFDQLDRLEKPKPEFKPKPTPMLQPVPRAPSHEKLWTRIDPASPAQRLLDWIYETWDQDTVGTRDIRIWGPYGMRSREEATRLLRILAVNGWVAPIPTQGRYKTTRFQIIPRDAGSSL